MNEFITLSTLVLIATATLSLLVGGVGIVNMMLTSVQQRIKEIGVRKAFGATNLSIRTQFLLETIYICLFGGVLGIIIGFVMYEMIIFIVSQFFPAVKFQFFLSWSSIIFSFLALIITSLICGIIPALQAEKVDIIFAQPLKCL